MRNFFNLGVPDAIKNNMFFPLSVGEVLSSPDRIVIKTSKGNLGFYWEFSDIYGVEKDFSGHTVSISGLVASDQIVSVDRVDQQTVRIALINGNEAFVKFQGDIETISREEWDYDDEVLSPHGLLDIDDSIEFPDGLWSAQTVVFIPLLNLERIEHSQKIGEKETAIRVLKNEVAQKNFLVEKTKREFLIFSFLQKLKFLPDFAYPFEFNEKMQEVLKSNEGLDLDAQALRVKECYLELTDGLIFNFTNGKKYTVDEIKISAGSPMTHFMGIKQNPPPEDNRVLRLIFKSTCGDVNVSKFHIGGSTYDTWDTPGFQSLNREMHHSRKHCYYEHQIHQIQRGDEVIYEDYPVLGCWTKEYLGDVLFGEQKQNFLPETDLEKIPYHHKK